MATMKSSPGVSEDYSGTTLVVFTAIFVPVQIFCVALRYLARYIIQGPWGLDDVLVLASLILQLCMAGISIGTVRNAGVGYHVTYLKEKAPYKLTVWGKYLVAIEFLYLGSVNIPKLAILALYRRLFSIKYLRVTLNILMGVLLAQTLSNLVAASVACIPFAANWWDPKLQATVCLDKEALFRWSSFPNIITDIIMLVLPVRVVWNLHTTKRFKIALTLTFAVGSFGLITSIVRLTAFFKNNSFIDGTWAAVDLIIWTQIETGFYLISACLLTYRPLLDRIELRGIVGRLSYLKTGDESKVKVSEHGSPSTPLNVLANNNGVARMESPGLASR